MDHIAEYAVLFATAFLAATIFPAQSEIFLAGMIMAERYPICALLAVASVGNVLGSVVNWMLGRCVGSFRDRLWFPVSRQRIAKAEHSYRRWGKWSLLLSWAPFIGDALTMVAGILREPLPVFLALVTIAKVGRYLVVAWLALET